MIPVTFLPLENEKRSLLVPPVKFSMPVNVRVASVPVLVPVMFQVLATLLPTKVSEPAPPLIVLVLRGACEKSPSKEWKKRQRLRHSNGARTGAEGCFCLMQDSISRVHGVRARVLTASVGLSLRRWR